MSASQTSWQFYLTSHETWDAMYKACEEATSSIDFEQFIFQTDEIAERFTNLFVKKVEQGVRVRLLCDTAGSYTFYLSFIPDDLRAKGVHIEFFNEINPWRIGRFNMWFSRDHRKLLIVDRHTAFVGGVGISDRFKNWRDTEIKITGPIVFELQAAFDHMWWIAGRNKFIRFKEPRQDNDGFTVLTNAPHRRQRHINKSLLDIIRTAKKSVYITTPYFVPDARFFRVLRLSARRGLDVRILIPKSSDHPYVDFASHFYYKQLFKVGGKIFHYNGEMVHAKTMVIDDDWASVGSANIDNLSSFFNYEILVATHNKKFVEEVSRQFLHDLTLSQEVSGTEWETRSLWQKLFELICIPFASFF